MRKKESKIRFSGRHVFLTYPKCDIPLEDLHGLLMDKLHKDHNYIKNYIIAHELHKDGDLHRHCWLELSRAPERVEASYFDVNGYHGNYQTIKFEDNCAKYVLKGGDYISSFTNEQLQQKIERAAVKGDRKIDKHEIGRRLMGGESLLNIIHDNPALMFDLGKLRDNLLLYKQLSSTAKPLEELKNVWIWGPTGSGKSKYCAEQFPNAHIKTREVFWDSYEFEEEVVCQDVDETWEDVLWELKIWADHYVYQGRIKHKPSLKMRPKRIIVTSNYTIQEVMERVFKRKGIRFDGELIRALERRFEVIKLDYTHKPEELNLFPDDYFALPSDWNKENEITYDKFLN